MHRHFSVWYGCSFAPIHLAVAGTTFQNPALFRQGHLLYRRPGTASANSSPTAEAGPCSTPELGLTMGK